MATKSIVVVTAGLSEPSTTRLLADQLAAATDRALRLLGDRAEITVIELRRHAHAIADATLTGFASGELAIAIDALGSADAVIAVTPTFRASYAGLFKSFIDVLDDEALVGKPMLVAATGGTGRHSLVLEFALRPLFAYLKAIVVPTAVFGATEDFGTAGASPLVARVETASRELAQLVHGRAAPGPPDPFGGVVPFEDLLR